MTSYEDIIKQEIDGKVWGEVTVKGFYGFYYVEIRTKDHCYMIKVRNTLKIDAIRKLVIEDYSKFILNSYIRMDEIGY